MTRCRAQAGTESVEHAVDEVGGDSPAVIT